METDVKPIIKKGKATELSQKVAEILVNLRDDRHMSQREFADSIGVSFQQYQKYEKGRDRLSLERAILLCSHLNLPLDVFKEGVMANGFAETEQEGFASKAPQTAEERELLELFAQIPKKNKKNFLEAVRQLAKMT